jgi:tRNA(Ile)-lysidine synthase
MSYPLEASIAAAWPPESWRDIGVLVAVSGGADSVALLRILARLKAPGPGRLAVAHFNHALRGADSLADEQFVAALAESLGLPCHLGRAAPAELQNAAADGLEAAARAARYDFLQATAEAVGARYLVTAHTADDQAETILHRILRGTGLAGLTGIGRVRTLGPAVTAIRPLLGVRRREVLDYLAAIDQPYRDDSSNAELRFTRNRIRHRLLPLLATEYNPAVVDVLLRLGVLAGEAQAVIDGLVAELIARAVTYETATVRIDTTALPNQPRHLIREMLIAVWQCRGWPLQAMGFAQWDLLCDLLLRSLDPLAALPQQQMFPGRIIVRVERGQVVISAPM